MSPFTKVGAVPIFLLRDIQEDGMEAGGESSNSVVKYALNMFVGFSFLMQSHLVNSNYVII